uniref:Uncharacterized protein n=1 Tax=Arundo donax TaxID=35708 RepID=A0A0A8ZWW7_ARUDO
MGLHTSCLDGGMELDLVFGWRHVVGTENQRGPTLSCRRELA